MSFVACDQIIGSRRDSAFDEDFVIGICSGWREWGGQVEMASLAHRAEPVGRLFGRVADGQASQHVFIFGEDGD